MFQKNKARVECKLKPTNVFPELIVMVIIVCLDIVITNKNLSIYPRSSFIPPICIYES